MTHMGRRGSNWEEDEASGRKICEEWQASGSKTKHKDVTQSAQYSSQYGSLKNKPKSVECSLFLAITSQYKEVGTFFLSIL